MNPAATSYRRAIEAARADPVAFVRLCGLSCSGVHAELQRLWTEHDRSVVYLPVSAGKTVQNAYRLVWDLGRDPNTRIGFVSATEGLGKNVASVLRTLIKDDPMVRRVFPHLRMHESQMLDRQEEFRVARPNPSPDPSFKVFGARGEDEARRWAGARAEVAARGSFSGRVAPRGARIDVEDGANDAHPSRRRGRVGMMRAWLGSARGIGGCTCSRGGR